MRSSPYEYNGTKFRSTLEARWAYFFDLIGIKYIYEPEYFYLPESEKVYTPDFYLPEYDTFLEVKPIKTEQRGWLKVNSIKFIQLSHHIRKPVWLAGDILKIKPKSNDESFIVFYQFDPSGSITEQHILISDCCKKSPWFFDDELDATNHIWLKYGDCHICGSKSCRSITTLNELKKAQQNPFKAK